MKAIVNSERGIALVVILVLMTVLLAFTGAGLLFSIFPPNNRDWNSALPRYPGTTAETIRL